jgi:putative IMPACT (imprinted ancient) family translation regulator
VADEFVDAGESARTADRPMLKAMLRRVAEGEINAIVVRKIDRTSALDSRIRAPAFDRR